MRGVYNFFLVFSLICLSSIGDGKSGEYPKANFRFVKAAQHGTRERPKDDNVENEIILVLWDIFAAKNLFLWANQNQPEFDVYFPKLKDLQEVMRPEPVVMPKEMWEALGRQGAPLTREEYERLLPYINEVGMEPFLADDVLAADSTEHPYHGYIFLMPDEGIKGKPITVFDEPVGDGERDNIIIATPASYSDKYKYSYCINSRREVKKKDMGMTSASFFRFFDETPFVEKSDWVEIHASGGKLDSSPGSASADND